MKTIKVISPDSKVLIAECIKGSVNAVCINRCGSVDYQCSWWNGDSRNLAWVSSSEVRPDGSQPQTSIGFK
ncbi:MAG: hypothetical protein WAW39_16015 [Prosthecobacter sp.]|uniref:hypothetical protein n=1 Tax=Prosthecobacter sp. TaxID=1965333 RepID=UPI003BB16AB2